MSISRIRVRKRENPYVQIDKATLNDNRISFRAKGLHAYLLSKPDSWVVYIKQLEKESPREGRDAIASAIKELENAGYIARQKIRHDDGKFGGWETVVYETPELASLDMSESTPRTDNPVSVEAPRTDKPKSVEPKSVEPKSANPHLVIKDSSHNGAVVKKERKEKDLRTREKSEETKTEDVPHTVPIEEVHKIVSGFLGTHTLNPQANGREVHANAEGEIEDESRLAAAWKRRIELKQQAEQLARARQDGLEG